VSIPVRGNTGPDEVQPVSCYKGNFFGTKKRNLKHVAQKHHRKYAKGNNKRHTEHETVLYFDDNPFNRRQKTIQDQPPQLLF
jgi:hypothetical protein